MITIYEMETLLILYRCKAPNDALPGWIFRCIYPRPLSYPGAWGYARAMDGDVREAFGMCHSFFLRRSTCP